MLFYDSDCTKFQRVCVCVSAAEAAAFCLIISFKRSLLIKLWSRREREREAAERKERPFFSSHWDPALTDGKASFLFTVAL